MVKLLVFSDVHMEKRPDWAIPGAFPDYDVAVVAGDVAWSTDALVRGLAEEPGLRDRPVVTVAGNHELYGRVLDEGMTDRARAETNVNFLDRGSVVLSGVRFLGATMWTDYALYGERHRDRAMYVANRTINDHVRVRRRVGRMRGPFKATHALDRHRADLAWLRAELATPFPGPTVVVTHHAPHPLSIHERYEGRLSNAAYASDLTPTIEEFRPELWVHGHVHDSFDYRVGKTRVLCNPKGYGPDASRKDRENPAFDEALVVEV